MLFHFENSKITKTMIYLQQREAFTEMTSTKMYSVEGYFVNCGTHTCRAFTGWT